MYIQVLYVPPALTVITSRQFLKKLGQEPPPGAVFMEDVRKELPNAASLGGKLSLLPIMLGTGTGSEVMRRIAAPMVGGMVSATVLTLLVIPAVYMLWKSREVGKSA